VRWQAWVDGPGVPENAPHLHSPRLDAILSLGKQLPSEAQAKNWAPVEWQVYLTGLNAPVPLELCEALDRTFQLTERDNYEILVDWLSLAVRSGYAKAVARTEAVLAEVGRMKYLKPLYLALLSREETKGLAHSSFERCKDGYHPIAAHVVGKLLTQG
jgi:hypothetical protein